MSSVLTHNFPKNRIRGGFLYGISAPDFYIRFACAAVGMRRKTAFYRRFPLLFPVNRISDDRISENIPVIRLRSRLPYCRLFLLRPETAG